MIYKVIFSEDPKTIKVITRHRNDTKDLIEERNARELEGYYTEIEADAKNVWHRFIPAPYKVENSDKGPICEFIEPASITKWSAYPIAEDVIADPSSYKVILRCLEIPITHEFNYLSELDAHLRARLISFDHATYKPTKDAFVIGAFLWELKFVHKPTGIVIASFGRLS